MCTDCARIKICDKIECVIKSQTRAGSPAVRS